jgi:hypothetical protein
MTKAVISYGEKQDPRFGRDISVAYVNNDRSFAQSYLNINAFPHGFRDEVQACTTRFAIFHNQLKLLYQQIDIDKKKFGDYIHDPRMKLAEVLLKPSKDRFIAKYDGIEALAYVHNLFNSLKSFLDVYTLLLGRLISENQTMSFKRKTIDGESVSGGAFIKWLRSSAPASFVKASNLAEFIHNESKEWITEAVNHRDSISHYTDIDDINCLSVELLYISKESDPMFKESEILDPRMPDGNPVLDYSIFLGERLRQYVIKTIGMFDNVDHKLLHFPEFNIKEEIWP